MVWHLAGNGWTIEQIVDELSKHPNGIGAKYATRLLAEVTRSFGKWQRRRRAHAQAPPPQQYAPAADQDRSGELPRAWSMKRKTRCYYFQVARSISAVACWCDQSLTNR